MNNTKKIEKKFNRDFSTLLKVHKVKKKDTVFLHVKLKNIKKKYNISYKRIFLKFDKHMKFEIKL